MDDRRQSKKVKGTKQQHKRKSTLKDDIISWDEYFMGIAFLSAKRSKYEVRKVGACIVNNENRIVATGYNGYIDPPETHGKQNNEKIFSDEEKSKSEATKKKVKEALWADFEEIAFSKSSS